MTAVPYPTSMDPGRVPTTGYPDPNVTPGVTPGLLTTTRLPWEEEHMQVHTVLIIIIFCVVCFLLMVTFLYAFCFRCSIDSPPKDSRPAPGVSLDREDATFKRSSSDCQSVGNVV